MMKERLIEAVRKDGVFEGINDIVDMEMYTIHEITEARSPREEYEALRRLTMWYLEKCHFSAVRCLRLTSELYKVALIRKEV